MSSEKAEVLGHSDLNLIKSPCHKEDKTRGKAIWMAWRTKEKEGVLGTPSEVLLRQFHPRIYFTLCPVK